MSNVPVPTAGILEINFFNHLVTLSLFIKGQNRGGTMLRRSMSQQAGSGSNKPPPVPPARRCSASQEEEQGSNTTTPRGSMEFLPPPPPHLLHSDEDEEEEGGVGEGEVVTKRVMSVAESVRELQRRQSQQQVVSGRQSSPATLR